MHWVATGQIMVPPSPLNARGVPGMWIIHCGEQIVGWNDTLTEPAWVVACAGTAFCVQLIAAAELVIAPNDGGRLGQSEVLALDPRSGAVVWREALDFRPDAHGAAGLDDSVFLFAHDDANGRRLVELDAHTGQRRSITPVEDDLWWVTASGGQLALGGRDRLHVGRVDTGFSTHSSAENKMLAVAGEHLYFVSDDEDSFEVCWWDGASASERGRTRFPGRRPGTALIPIGNPGQVAMEPSPGAGLVAVDLSSGRQLWTACSDGGWSVRSGAATPHGLVVALEDEAMETRVAVLDPHTGEECPGPETDGDAELIDWFDERLVVGSSLMVEAFSVSP